MTRSADVGECIADLADRLGVSVNLHNTLVMPGALVAVNVTDHGARLDLDHIYANPQGTGAGAQIMQALREHCAERGKQLTVKGVQNRRFFDRFDWLRCVDAGDGEDPDYVMTGAVGPAGRRTFTA